MFLKNKNIIFKIRRLKVTDYAALKCYRITEKLYRQCEQDSQWSKQEACFALATRSWLTVNHNTSVIPGE